MAFLAGGGPSHPEINVTPLIDVLLVLIIVFMVVDSMKPKQEGLPAELPQQAQDNPQRASPLDRTIIVQVIERNGQPVPSLKINQEEVSWNDLQGRLQEIFKQRAERIAFVRSENEVDFQYVADVIDTARVAGVNRVGLLTTNGEREVSKFRGFKSTVGFLPALGRRDGGGTLNPAPGF